MIDITKFLDWLEKLMSDKFYGTLEITLKKGQIVLLTKHETIQEI
jgi:hypothetical protein